MSKSLLIVESPTKVKTLSKFLGKDYTIKATYGHIKDLPKSKIGVDIEHGFSPDFITVKGKGKVVDEIKKASKNADTIYVGSDPDREGEAIAFHVAEIIGAKKTIKRILFHEITKKGVLEALKTPTTLNESKYDAQKSRRILDRLVGYKISPLLWEKLSYGLSAGRVQSVALRLICDREAEIEGFVKEEYWTIDAQLELASGKTFIASLDRINDRKAKINTGEEANRIRDILLKQDFAITGVEKKDKTINPQPAFITSSLQQEASRKLRFTPKRTMMLAQKLYEGIDIGEQGSTGLITYMRTDSVRVSEGAIQEARDHIRKDFGESYLPKTPNRFRNRKSAQDAHEAIRPTYVHLTPEKIKPYLDRDLLSLYELIWKRFISSQMVQKKIKITTVTIKSGDYTFLAKGSTVIFDGFTKIYEETSDDTEKDTQLPDIKENDLVTLLDVPLNQRFTAPPPRFTEATLIKTLETKGIGRPSTYATIVSTIQERDYVARDKGRLLPTQLGRTVSNLLKEFFPLILDTDFTAKMEERLDLIEDGKKNWVKSLEKFYHFFEKELDSAKKGMKSLKAEEQQTDIPCDKCAKPMLLRWGKNGNYLVCSGKPECKNKKNASIASDGTIRIVDGEIRGTCERCGGNIVVKTGRFGRFLACNNYPDCKFTAPYNLDHRCPVADCTGVLVEKQSKKKKKRFISCSRYPECTFATNYEPADGPCPSCGAPTLFTFRNRLTCLRKDCGWKSRS